MNRRDRSTRTTWHTVHSAIYDVQDKKLRLYAQENFDTQWEVSVMAEQTHIQRLRGDTAKNDAYTGVDGEFTINQDSQSIRIHDGEKKGGYGTIDAMHYAEGELPAEVPNDLRTGAHVTMGNGRLEGGDAPHAEELAGDGLIAQGGTLNVDVDNLAGDGLTSSGDALNVDLDTLDGRYVKTVGDETISGKKTFNSITSFEVAEDSVHIYHPAWERGTVPQSNTNAGIIFGSSNSTSVKTGTVINAVKTDGSVSTYISARPNIVGAAPMASIALVYPREDETTAGVPYATCPTPEDALDNSNKIATTEWVRKLCVKTRELNGEIVNVYVNATTGSDKLDTGRGLSEDKPFKTIMACMDYIHNFGEDLTERYSTKESSVIVNIAPGDYYETLSVCNINSFQITLQGSTDGTVNIYGDEGIGSFAAFDCNYFVYVKNINFKLQSNAVVSSYMALVHRCKRVTFTSCTFELPATLTTATVVLDVAYNGYAVLMGCTITNLSTKKHNALRARYSGIIMLRGDATTITGAYSDILRMYTDARMMIDVETPSFVGDATGRKYNISGWCTLDTNAAGTDLLPGNSEGVTSGSAVIL